ncbi:MAG TPA: glycosyltransferase family 2 protein [Candidatus Magasanikbacteria bacterium]|nr:glycosyltransferase family 2 protein [Candidatus Magasanikbacteria bacterium]
MQKLVIQLVTWNGKKYIPYLFDSLRKQTFADFHLSIFDNSSTDGTVEAIVHELSNFQSTHTFTQNKENLGFAGGHNQLFKDTSNSNYILLLNQDIYLTPDCIEKMVLFLDTHQNAAAVTPRLMRWNFEEAHEGVEKSFSFFIDTLGLRVFRNRRVIEKYAGKPWEDKKSRLELSFRTHDDAMEVFGVSGALPMFRRTCLEIVSFEDHTFFDTSYQSYKEDVDLAYRLRIAGFQSYILLDTVAYHDRSAPGAPRMGDRISFQNKKTQSEWVKYHSYKNHLITLYKNEYWQNTTLDFPWILWYELKKFIYFLCFDRHVLKGLGEVWKARHELRKKRALIKHLRKVSWQDMREWWK